MSYFQDRCHDRELVAAHEMTGPVEHFEIKWEKIYLVDIIYLPLDLYRSMYLPKFGDKSPLFPYVPTGLHDQETLNRGNYLIPNRSKEQFR